ncbi:M28 family peptidase [Spirosoma validum]|uniref:M28 family peptidase n=1 Tax=Spirosoma validum TaxID=2771355 RepID=A0A927GEE6_9BACT|nr:M28 family peptidase [Spirosoma validum]MBD2754762.1 M28 family peptidase [Spirosoma validum]
MTYKSFLLATSLLGLPLLSFAQEKFATTITSADLEKQLRILAADDMEGRETGTRGQRKAAEYIASQFAAYGLKPIVKTADGKLDYQQHFTLYKKTWGDFYVSAGGKRFEYLKDFVTNGLLNLPTETNYETVFVGYGISEASYDDYAGRDVTGKALVMAEGEPKTADGKSKLSGTSEASKWGGPNGWRAKSLLAKQKGAGQIFIISAESAEAFKTLLSQRGAMQQRFNRLSLKPGAENVGSMGIFLVTAETGATLLNTSTDALNQLTTSLAQAEKPVSSSLTGSLSVKAERVDEKTESSNVLGFLEGTDKKDEVLIVSSHYDHIGISPDGQINNGANDDGSGTVSVIEIAQAFAQAKAAGKGPRRSVLFLTVSGEEKGLLGSEYYADMSPVIPLDKTVGDLNIDMVGRVDDLHQGKSDNYIYVIGSDKLSSELHKISEAANQTYTKMELDYKYNDPKDPERIYYRSDHYNFAKHNIPIIFYFNGLHADYHKPTDDAEKIDFKLAERSARLVFYTAWDIANRDQRLVVDSHKQ